MVDKEFRRLIRAAEEQGWRVRSIKKGLMLVPPDPTKAAVTIHRTPSDRRSWNNAVAQLRSSGLEWPWPPES